MTTIAVAVRGPGSHVTSEGHYKATDRSPKLAKTGRARRIKRYLGNSQRPYECASCLGWHLAKNPKRGVA